MAEPTLFLVETYNEWGALPLIGKALPAAQVPGFAGDYGVRDQATVERAVQGRAPLSPFFADPGHTFDRPKFAGKDAAPWVAGKAPQTRAAWNTLLTSALNAQRALTPDYLLAPGVQNHGGQGTQMLERQVSAIRAAFANRPATDPEWLARICVHDEWVMVPAERARLLNELSDLPDEMGIALQVMWSKRGAAVDRASLESLREVIRALVRDDRKVIVLDGGLVGWLATGWGASGFTAGLPNSSWSDESRIPGGRAKGSKNKDWYFEPRLLLRVERADHQRLAAQQGYPRCPCVFCTQVSLPWKRNAERHALWSLARISAQTQAATLQARTQKVRAILDDAATQWRAWAAPVLNRRARATASAPHLDLWRSLV